MDDISGFRVDLNCQVIANQLIAFDPASGSPRAFAGNNPEMDGSRCRHCVCQKNQLAGRQALRWHPFAIPLNDIPLTALSRSQGNQPTMGPGVGIENHNSPIGWPFGRTERPRGAVGCRGQCSIQQHLRAVGRLAEVALLHFPDGILKIGLGGILRAPGVFGAQCDITPGFIELSLRHRFSRAEHGP